MFARRALMNDYIHVEGVSKSFTDPTGRTQHVLNNLTLSIPEGSLTILEGPSGSGKSTLLNLMAGMILPDEGEIRVGGERINRLSETRRDSFRARRVGVIFQTFNLLSPLTALENLTVPAILSGSSNGDERKLAMEILDTFGLADQAHKRPYLLSVGQRQRVAIARALLRKPELLLADEPTASLDADSSAIVIESMENMRKSGTTIVVATHDPVFFKLPPDLVFNVTSGEVRA
jgi:putative ABC transport system ATP-binding protein